jgi:5-methylcytosine-specific restriction endonuclease McrA
MICYEFKICNKCQVSKELINYRRKIKLTGRLVAICKACESLQYKEKNTNPERRAHHRARNEKYREWYRAYHKSPIGRQKAKEMRQKPEHRRLRIALEAKRRANQIKRTPPWADLKAINDFYKNCPDGMQVDHIIPLQGKTVSGFHILENLQYLTPTENFKKNNKF